MTKNIFLLSILTISTLTQAQSTPDKPVLEAIRTLQAEVNNLNTTVKANEKNAQAERKAMQGILDKSLKLIKKGGRGGRFVAIALGSIIGGTATYGYGHGNKLIELSKNKLRELLETTTKTNNDEASTKANSDTEEKEEVVVTSEESHPDSE